MIQNEFYEIRTKKSQTAIAGYYQITLCSKNQPGIQCFLWFSQTHQIKHIQLIFEEQLIEWFDERGIVVGYTNRKQDSGIDQQIGYHKGVRTVHETTRDELKVQGIQLIHNSVFPKDYDQLIKERFPLPR